MTRPRPAHPWRRPVAPLRWRQRTLAAIGVPLLLLGACTPDEDTEDEPTVEPDAGEPDAGDETQPDDQQTPDTGSETGSDAVAPLTSIPDLVREVAPQTVAIEVSGQQRGQMVQGAGSGVIYSADGVIVTNEHVVGPADDITVVLADGSRFAGETIATDVRTDLAIVQIDASGIPEATFSDELPDIGELAVALGNPFGFQNTATAGIVSGIDRSLPVAPGRPPLVGLIQTDAAISSGSSGGALVGAAGEVIGINVAVVGGAQAPGVAQGLGFAIPSTTVNSVVEQLLERGEVAHAFLGIVGATLSPQLAERFGLDREDGVLVGEVAPGSPAEQAGLQQGDVIIGLGDERIAALGDLLTALRRAEPGDTVEITAVRDGDERSFEATLSEPPEDQQAEEGR